MNEESSEVDILRKRAKRLSNLYQTGVACYSTYDDSDEGLKKYQLRLVSDSRPTFPTLEFVVYPNN